MLTYITDTMPELHLCKFIVNNMFTLILHMVRPDILKANKQKSRSREGENIVRRTCSDCVIYSLLESQRKIRNPLKTLISKSYQSSESGTIFEPSCGIN